MKPVVLFRKLIDNQEEITIAQKYFDVHTIRETIPENSLVIGRYSVLPYYKELEDGLKLKNCQLINSYEQHKYIANAEWIADVSAYTPKTWTDLDFYNAPQESSYVIKGCTNSKKNQWDSLMFAANRKEASIKAG